MKTYFFLSRKRTNKNGKAPIYCRIQNSSGDRIDFSSGQFILPEQWNRQTKRPDKSLLHENKILDHLENKVKNAILKQVVNESDNIELIYKTVTGKGSKQINRISDRLNEYLKHIKAPPRTKIDTIRLVNEFERYISTPIHQMTINTPTAFEIAQINKGIKNSTIAKKQSILKRIFNYFVNCDIIQKSPYRLYKAPKAETKEKIHLTIDQLHELQQKTFAQKRLNEVKNTFLFQCYTGLSYCDLKAFEQHKLICLSNTQYLTGTRKKTGSPFYIPLYEYAKHTIESNNKINVISNQKYNSYLKEIADLMDYSFALTSHIARKTFAQQMINKGFSWDAVARMLGHNKTTVTQKHYATIEIERINNEVNKLVA